MQMWRVASIREEQTEMKITTLATTVAVLALGATSQAVNIASWTFETSVPTTGGPHAAEAGVNAASSFASGFHSNSAVVYSNPAGNGSLESFSSDRWDTIGDYYQFSFSTAGYQNVTFGWDQAKSNTGPADFTLQVSVNGGGFNTLSSYTVLASGTTGPGVWGSTTYLADYTFAPLALTGSNNAANVTVRLVSSTAVASTGTNRVDNVFVNADAVPEPATMAIVGLGIAAVARRKRK